MTDDPRRQEELIEAELPAVELLRLFDYAPLAPEELAALRASPAEPILVARTGNMLRQLNPWLDEDGTRRVLTAITRISAIDLIEANEKAHTIISMGTTSSHTDVQGRRRDRTVRFIDFEDIRANRFEFARQYRVKGPRQEIVLDVPVFVNGLPLAVIETKAPSLPDPMGEGIDQFRRYEGLDEFQGLGAPRLFETAQVLIVAAKDELRYGTTAAPRRFWAEWKDPYPIDVVELERRLGRSPSAQDVALAGLLRPENLLDLVRNFIVFETEDGRRTKKIARYQQFIAVQEAIHRIRTANASDRRGGVIHHTQGSGKSLTMVFLATKLRRLAEAENPTMVVVTDRTELDDQITATFQRCGFPNPMQAESGQHLRELLSGGAGPTVLSTVHKFHTAVPNRQAVLTDASNVFVLTDEAHRTQYGSLAARMRAGLPNACMIAFTGTPIDKRDRSTRAVFGDYIHCYQIDQAVRDGATVPIYYEMRDARLHIEGKDLERELRWAFRDLDDAAIEELKRNQKLGEVVATSRKRIEEICRDLIEHYRSTVEPNGFKAQIVTVGREAAVTYKEMLDYLGAPESAVIMSASNDDKERLRRHHLSPRDREDRIARFKKKGDPLKIIVVCDMLLTGFDAPIEQVMYLDAPLREHTLLQAIARVNRTAVGKTYGLVVDYWGDSTRIGQALNMFSSQEIEGALLSSSQKVEQMQSRHRAVMRYFDGVRREDDEACLRALELDDVRAAFDIAFRHYAEAVDMVLPDPAALGWPYETDLKWLAGTRNRARRRYRDERLDLRGYGAKVRALIETHLSTEGVETLLDPVSILSPEFQAQLRRLASDEARASEMEHAIRHEIHVHRDENPVVFRSLWEKLQRLIDERRENRISAAAALGRLDDLAQEVRSAREGRAQGGLKGTAGVVFDLLPTEDPDDDRAGLARLITAAVEDLAVVDWHQKEDIQRQMRRAVKRELRAAGIGAGQIEAIAARVLDVARARMVR